MKLFLPKKDEIKSPKAFFLEEDDLLGDLTEKKGTSLFLGKYAMHEVESVLRKRNFYREAKKRDLWPLMHRMDSSHFPPLQRLLVYYQKEDPDHIIADLKIREGHCRVKDPASLIRPFPDSKFLILEWLTLQNPNMEFARDRSPLPGQKHPGLGLGHKIIDLFIYLARINRNDGILAFPAYFHNALLFSRRFQFLNPDKRGEVQAIRKAFHHVPFKKLAWIVHTNCLIEEGKGTYEWKAEEQVCPISTPLKRYFESHEYKSRLKQVLRDKKFTINWEKFSRVWKSG